LDVFYHVREKDIDRVLAEIARVARHEGFILVTDPLKDNKAA